MCANTANCVIFSINVNYTDIFTVNLNFFHMRRLNVHCISNLNKILTQYEDHFHYKAESLYGFLFEFLDVIMISFSIWLVFNSPSLIKACTVSSEKSAFS